MIEIFSSSLVVLVNLNRGVFCKKTQPTASISLPCGPHSRGVSRGATKAVNHLSMIGPKYVLFVNWCYLRTMYPGLLDCFAKYSNFGLLASFQFSSRKLPLPPGGLAYQKHLTIVIEEYETHPFFYRQFIGIKIPPALSFCTITYLK